jgi:hypothetical protein
MRLIFMQISLILVPLFSTIIGVIADNQGGGIVYTSKGSPHSIGWLISADRLRINFTVTRYLDAASPDPPSADEWFAIGLGPKKTMLGSDMYVVRMQPQLESCLVTDRFSRDYVEPEEDSQLGGRNDVEWIGFTAPEPAPAATSMMSCTFTRLLDTGDRGFDFTITNNPLTLFWASGKMRSGAMLQHRGTIGSIEVNLFEAGYQLPRRSNDLRFWHGLLMLTSWFMLMIPATFLARYMKALMPQWFKYHWRIQAAGTLMAYAGALIAFVAMDYRVATSNPHTIIGLVMILMLLVQIILGYLSNALWFEGKPPAVYPDKLHWWNGRLLLVGGAVNCLLGVWLFREINGTNTSGDYSISIWMLSALIVVILLASVAMEVGIGAVHEHLIGSHDNERLLSSGEKSVNEESAGGTAEIEHHYKWRWSGAFGKTFCHSIQLIIILLTAGVGLALYME